LRLDPAGFPFIGGALVAALIAGYFAGWRVALVFVAFAAFFAFFFRDPDRTSPAGDHQVLSPADGRVMVAGAVQTTGAPPGN
jgi:phosphatidylserine decarboxylase